VAWVYDDKLTIFHAGDTSALLIGNERIVSLTSVHEMENGAIYRYFGLGPFLQFEIKQEELPPVERILLLTDGVTKVFHPKEAAQVVSKRADPARAVRDLANLAVYKGSTDDITILLIEVEDY
jgi:PPM family protein phosphatase